MGDEEDKFELVLAASRDAPTASEAPSQAEPSCKALDIVVGTVDPGEVLPLLRTHSASSSIKEFVKALFDHSPVDTVAGLKRRVRTYQAVLELLAAGDLEGKSAKSVRDLLSTEADAMPGRIFALLVEQALNEFVTPPAARKDIEDDSDVRVNGALPALEFLPKFIHRVIGFPRGQLDPDCKCKVDYSEMNGRQFYSHVLTTICSASWPAISVVSVATVLVSLSEALPLDDIQMALVLDKVLAQFSRVKLTDLTVLLKHVLSLSSGPEVLRRLTVHFDSLDAQCDEADRRERRAGGAAVASSQLIRAVNIDRRTLQQVEGGIIAEFMLFTAQDPLAGKQFLKQCTENTHALSSLCGDAGASYAPSPAAFASVSNSGNLLTSVVTLSPFRLGMLLAVGRVKRFEHRVIDALYTYIISLYRDADRRSNSAWLQELSRQSLEKTAAQLEQDEEEEARNCNNGETEFRSSLLQVIDKGSAGGWDLLTPCLLSLSTVLMDRRGTAASDIRDDALLSKAAKVCATTAPPTHRAAMLGLEALCRIFKHHQIARVEILERITSRLLAFTEADLGALQWVRLLARLAANYPAELIGHRQRVKDLIGYLPSMPSRVAQGIIRATAPLLMPCPELGSYSVLVYKKSLFQKSIDARLIGVYGLVTLLSYAVSRRQEKRSQMSMKEPSNTSSSALQAIENHGGESPSPGKRRRASAVSTSQGSDSHSENDDDGSFTLTIQNDVLGCLRRCLSQQAGVRQAVYAGLACIYIHERASIKARLGCQTGYTSSLQRAVKQLVVPHLERFLNVGGDRLDGMEMDEDPDEEELLPESPFMLDDCIDTRSKFIHEPLHALIHCVQSIASSDEMASSADIAVAVDTSGASSSNMTAQHGKSNDHRLLKILRKAATKASKVTQISHLHIDKMAALNPGSVDRLKVELHISSCEAILDGLLLAKCQGVDGEGVGAVQKMVDPETRRIIVQLWCSIHKVSSEMAERHDAAKQRAKPNSDFSKKKKGLKSKKKRKTSKNESEEAVTNPIKETIKKKKKAQRAPTPALSAEAAAILLRMSLCAFGAKKSAAETQDAVTTQGGGTQQASSPVTTAVDPTLQQQSLADKTDLNIMKSIAFRSYALEVLLKHLRECATRAMRRHNLLARNPWAAKTSLQLVNSPDALVEAATICAGTFDGNSRTFENAREIDLCRNVAPLLYTCWRRDTGLRYVKPDVAVGGKGKKNTKKWVAGGKKNVLTPLGHIALECTKAAITVSQFCGNNSENEVLDRVSTLMECYFGKRDANKLSVVEMRGGGGMQDDGEINIGHAASTSGIMQAAMEKSLHHSIQKLSATVCNKLVEAAGPAEEDDDGKPMRATAKSRFAHNEAMVALSIVRRLCSILPRSSNVVSTPPSPSRRSTVDASDAPSVSKLHYRQMHASWIQTTCERFEVDRPKLAEEMFVTYIELHRRAQSNLADLGPDQLLGKAVRAVMGGHDYDLEDDEQDFSNEFEVLTVKTCSVAVAVLMAKSSSAFEECDWVLSALSSRPRAKRLRKKAEDDQCSKDDEEDDENPAEEARANQRGIVESMLCARVEAIAMALTPMVRAALHEVGAADLLIKQLKRLYKTLQAIVKQTLGRQDAVRNLRPLARLVQRVGKKLTPHVYSLLIAMNGEKKNGEGRVKVTAIKKESKLVPELIFNIEQYETTLLSQCARHGSLQHLANTVKRSTARDFRLGEINKGSQGSNKGSQSSKGSCSSKSDGSGSQVKSKASKRCRSTSNDDEDGEEDSEEEESEEESSGEDESEMEDTEDEGGNGGR